MKRLSFLLIYVILYTGCQKEPDLVGIPDDNFLLALIEEGVDTDGDGLISYEEAEEVRALFIKTKGFICSNSTRNNITNLTGIEAFINLDTLWCSCCQLKILNLSGNQKLKYVNCHSNDLNSLDISNNTFLTELHCSHNQLTNLDVSNNVELVDLGCSNNQLTNLDVSNNSNLTSLWCGYNQLTTLDVSYNTALQDLACGGNPFTSLDVSNNINLSYLACYENQLSTLDISNNTSLTSLSCGGNGIATLDISNNKLLTSIWLRDMPSLYEVCVWDGFDSSIADTEGSPNVYFTSDCSK